MKMKIFEAIRNNSLEQVVACVEADPACVNAIAPKKPNDTKGMSPLQVALTTGWHRKIAWYLLEHGADVNFIEPPEIRKTAAHPAFFDADFDRVNAALFPNGTDGLEVYRWTTDWSDYFDDGHEWWGTLCLTVYDKSTGRFAVLLASATD